MITRPKTTKASNDNVIFVGYVQDRVWKRMCEEELLWIHIPPAAIRCRDVQHDQDREGGSTTTRGS